MVKGTTKLVGVLGWPVEHSLSPALHNAAFSALNLDWTYVPLPVSPADLRDALNGLRALGFRGANVTVPHKEKVLPLLDELSPEAVRIGAVNTIIARDGRLYGDNSDASGFLDALEDIPFDPAGCHALILGSGGSARAIAHGLLQRNARITLCGRNSSSVGALAEHLGSTASAAKVGTLCPEDIARANGRLDLIVNTTPAGMHPCVQESPWPHGAAMPRCKLVYDLVYHPSTTRFMQSARAQGIRAENGFGMLVHQAARSFSLWTGLSAPVDIMKQVPTPC